MNSYITIQVRVAARNAQAALQGVKSDIASVSREADVSRSALGGLAANIRPNLWQKFGNQLQWTGRQLERNFTLPIVLAGAAAAKFELDNEKAMTGVTKVYGDGSQVFNRLSKTEIPALGRAFESLSNEFGVNRKEVIDIGAAWAQAGSSGLALAKSVKLTLETMILGEMNATEATQALISIQAQYGQSIEQLSGTVDVLNMVENQTGITMQGLVQGFARAAGTARSAGVDVRHLAALLAALTPAAGSAANAGNSLKTIFSRLLAPTKQAADIMQKMGISINSVTWQSSNGVQRLELMAKKFDRLSGAQKVLVSTLVGSRFQINRFDVLMRELVSTTGYYARALNSTADATANYKQRQKELNIVLSSNPQRLKQVWTILQNAMADVIQPLLPALVYLSQVIVRFVSSFTNLDPSVQKLILTGAILLALVGPVVKYIGALGTLYGTFKFIFNGLALVTVALIKDLYLLISIPISGLTTVIGALVGWMIGAFKILAGLPELLLKGWALVGRGFAVIEAAFAGMGTFLVGMLAAVRGFVAVWATQMDILFTMVSAGVYTIPEAAAKGLFATLTLFGRFGSIAVATLSNVPLAIAKGFALLPLSVVASFRFLMGTFAALRGFTVVWATQMRLLFALVSAGIYTIPEAAGNALRVTATLFSRFAVAGFSVFRNLPAMIGTSMTRVVAVVRAGGIALIDAIDWPITLAIGAALILFGLFHKQLAQIWNNIVSAFQGNASGIMSAFKPIGDFFGNLINYIQRAFWSLPQSIQSAMLAVVHIVASAAEAVYHLFQYLNPFAHHSPSLVENTQKGMGKVQDHHKATAATAEKATSATAGHMNTVAQASSAVSNTSTRSPGQAVPAAVIKSHKDYQAAIQRDIQEEMQSQKAQQQHYAIWKTTQQDINALNRALGYLNTVWRQFADQRKAVKLIDPGALPTFDKLINDLVKLNSLLAKQQTLINKQQGVVDHWQAKLDAANAVVDTQQKKLSALQATLDKLTTAYQAHQDALDKLASTPITGEKALGDQIFNNQIAQKKLTLAMMQMEDAVGPLDKLQNKMASIQGDIEKLRGEQAALRQGGAGSEITGVYQQQIDALNKQQQVIQDQAKPLQDMQDQIDALDRKGQELQLLNDISFDPLHKQIDDLVNGMNEMSFDNIIKGIQGEQAAMASLQPQIDSAQKAVDQQQAMVDAANAAKDAIQARYDAEDKSLQTLQTEYGKTSASIQAVTDALNTLGNAAVQVQQKRASKKGAGKKGSTDATGAAFDAAAKGNFPDVGGAGKIGREGGLGDQSSMIDKFTQDQANELAKQFGSFDLFGPIKDQWKKLKGWFSEHVMPILEPIGAAFKNLGASLSHVFDGVSVSGIGATFKKAVSSVSTFLKPLIDTVSGVVRAIIAVFKLIEPDLKHVFDAIVTAFKKIWTQIGPELAKFVPLITPLLLAFKNVAITIGVILSPIIIAILFVFKELASVLGHVVGPALNMIVGIIAAVLQVIRGALEIIIGLLTGNFSMIWKGIVDLVGGTFKAIGNIIMGAIGIIWGIIKGLVEGIVGFFKWLFDELVGHSIIPDLINAIITWVTGLPGALLSALAGLGTALISLFTTAWNAALTAAQTAWAAIVTWVTGLPGEIVSGLASLGTMLITLFSTAWNAALTAAQTAWTAIMTWVTGLPGDVKSGMDSLVTKLGKLATDAWDAFWTAAKTAWKDVIGWFGDIPGKIHDAVVDVRTKLSNIATNAWNDFLDAAKTVWNDAKGVAAWFGEIPGKIHDAVVGVVDKLSGIATDAWNGFLTAAKSVWDGAKGVMTWVTSLPGKITKAATGMWDGISAAFTTAIGAIKSVWNDFANFWNGISLKVPEINTHIPGVGKIGGWTFSLPHLPLLAKGGVTTGPALIGEGRQAYPEFVIPTDPGFRSNAMSLYSELGRVLGLERSVLGAITGNSLKSPVAMASGGIVGTAVRRATRPVAAPVGGTGDGGRTELHFHGDLSFPNITSGDDAEAFIKNLESLAS